MGEDRAHVIVEDSRGLQLPYSKGLMSTSMMATGVGPEDAYRLAESIERRLLEEGRDKIATRELTVLVSEVLTEWGGTEAGERFVRWRRAVSSPQPIIILLGGATGVGKSTVATNLASRLGITRVVGTDAIREVMRNVFRESLLPTVYYSSFEADQALRVPVPEGHDPVLVAFRQQAEVVAIGIEGIVDRACREGRAVIVEGVHALPGLFEESAESWKAAQATVVQVVLVAPEENAHRARFYSRAAEGQGRDPNRYLDQFANIRKIQSYIRRLAQKHGVAEVHSQSLDVTIQDVLDLVVVQVAEAQ